MSNTKRKTSERLHSHFGTMETRERLLYSSGEIANLCGVSRKTWLDWVKKGWAPGGVLVGNSSRWIAADIERWIDRLRDEAVNEIFTRDDR